MVQKKQKSTNLPMMRSLLKQFTNQEFRKSYLDTHTKEFLSTQLRTLRGEKSQKAFAKILGVTQSVISRYENPGYGKVTLQTLIKIALKLDIALIVKFASYSVFLHNKDLSEEALKPTSFSHQDIEIHEAEIRETFNPESTSTLHNVLMHPNSIPSTGSSTEQIYGMQINAG